MKKWMFILSVLFLLSSCAEDVKFNNPAFQTLKDNGFWRAQYYTASISPSGNMIVTGYLGSEKVTLQTASPVAQNYVLGVDDISKASYSDTLTSQLAEFSTGENKGNGQITITEFNTQKNTISGTFKFVAINSDATNTDHPKISFTEGVFYKVPVTPSSQF